MFSFFPQTYAAEGKSRVCSGVWFFVMKTKRAETHLR